MQPSGSTVVFLTVGFFVTGFSVYGLYFQRVFPLWGTGRFLILLAGLAILIAAPLKVSFSVLFGLIIVLPFVVLSKFFSKRKKFKYTILAITSEGLTQTVKRCLEILDLTYIQSATGIELPEDQVEIVFEEDSFIVEASQKPEWLPKLLKQIRTAVANGDGSLVDRKAHKIGIFFGLIIAMLGVGLQAI